MSERLEDDSGYHTIDLDADKPGAPDLEIENVEDESPAPDTGPEVEPVTTPAPKPVAKQPAADDEDEAEADEGGDQTRKRLTRSQRLKMARDAAMTELAAEREKTARLESELMKRRGEAVEAASISMDLYIKTLDDKMKALRVEYDAAFDQGDRNKLWEVQTQIADIAAEKKTAERERRTIPTQAGPKSGGEAPPPTHTTTGPSTPPNTQAGKPDPRAVAWAQEHADWWMKDRRMTRRALLIDKEMQEDDGFDPNDADYYEELNRRMAKEFPDKFGADPAPKPRASSNPTVQGRGTPLPESGKIRVKITSEDRRMAEQLNIPIEAYAREKAKRERALTSPSQYTEIL
jgi:hypothetical protein